MATPVFALPVSGSDPKLTTKALLDGEVNRVIEALLAGSLSAAALGVAWPRVTTTGAGLGATTSGQMFVLANVGNSLSIYLNSAGTAVLQVTLPDQSAVLAAMRFEQRWSYLTPAALWADTVMTYSAGVVGTVAAGARVMAGRFAYVVDGSASTTYHCITTGGVKLILQRDLDWFERVKHGLNLLKIDNGPLVVGWSSDSNHGSNDDQSGSRATNAKVTIWNGSTFVLSQPGVSPLTNTYNVDGAPYAKPNEGPHWFGCRLAEETGRDVKIILDQRGSTPISQWKTDWAATDNLRDMFGNFSGRAAAALAFLGRTKLDIMVFGSGPANALTSLATFQADFYTVWGRFNTAAWFDGNRPFLTIEAPRDTVYATQNVLLADHHHRGIPAIRSVSTEGLAVDSSGIHYTGGGQQEIGYERCFGALLEFLAHQQPFDMANPYLPSATAGFVTPSEVPLGAPLAASGALDLLTSPANSGLVPVTGASPLIDTGLKGKIGYRTLLPSAALTGGTAIPGSATGATYALLGAHALPSSVAKGHTMTLLSATDALVTISASGGGTIQIDGAATTNTFLRMRDDAITLVSTGSNNWQVKSDARMSRVRSVSIANTVTVAIKTPAKAGYMRFFCNRDANEPSLNTIGSIFYDAGTTPQTTSFQLGSSATIAIGTASRLNVQAVTTDQIDVQNNTGATLIFNYIFD